MARILFRAIPASQHGIDYASLLSALAVFVLVNVILDILSARHLPGNEKFIAWLDNYNACGGLLLIKDDAGKTAWENQIKQLRRASIRIDCRRETALLLVAAAFAFCLHLCPQALGVPAQEKTLDITDETKDIEEQISLLEEETSFPDEKINELKEMLEDIRENSLAGDSAKTYEMLDLLENRVENSIAEARNDILDEGISMDKLAEALEQLANNNSETASTASAEIAKFLAELAQSDPEIAKMLQELAKDNENLSPSELARRTTDNPLTKEQMEKLAKALRDNADKIKEKLKRMAEKRGKQSGCENCGECQGGTCPFDEESLKEWLESNDLDCTLTACSAGSMNAPGSGAPSRGRGDAPLNYSGEKVDFNADFKQLEIEGQAKPDASHAIERTLAAPTEQIDDKTPIASGKLEGGKSSATSSSKPVHPQHRKAVRQYFGE